MEKTSQKVVGDAGKQRRYERSLASLIRCEDYFKLVYFTLGRKRKQPRGATISSQFQLVQGLVSQLVSLVLVSVLAVLLTRYAI